MATGGQINTDILSDEIFDVLCSMCKNQGKNAEGVKYCVDCKDYFCVNCVKVHSQVPVLVGHKVLDKSQVKSGTSKGLPRAPAERCDRHSHKHIDMYCQNHDNVGCSTCMAVDHRLCKDTFYIPEFIQNNTYKVASRDIQSQLKTLIKTFAEQADRFKHDKQRLLKRKAELLANIRKFRQEINEYLDKLEKSSIDMIENKVKCLEDKIEDGLKQLQANKSRVTSANDKLASSKTTDQAEEFVYVKMGENAANVANKYIEDAKSKNAKSTAEDIEFRPDRTIITQLEQKKALGILSEKPTKTAANLFQIKGNQSYNIKVKSDKNNCYITSACCMDDGTIILADHSNRKLKRFHSYNYTVTDYCDLPGYSHQVCMINNTEVAVTVPLQKEVYFVSLQRQMKTTNKINTDFECYGLAYANNNLYISNNSTSVYVYTLSGRKLNQISKDQSGRKMFSNICSLAVSQNATRIYVADYNNGLIVLDHNGQVITSFNGEQLKCAYFCSLTEAGSVLVSVNNSNNVLQFTCDGKLMGEVIKADSRKGQIRSVCCNQRMTKMCISRQGNDNIEVYDI